MKLVVVDDKHHMMARMVQLLFGIETGVSNSLDIESLVVLVIIGVP